MTIPEPVFDPDLREYVATVDGRELFGATWSQCNARIAEALRISGKHGVVALQPPGDPRALDEMTRAEIMELSPREFAEIVGEPVAPDLFASPQYWQDYHTEI